MSLLPKLQSPLEMLKRSQQGVNELADGIKTIQSGIQSLSSALKIETRNCIPPRPATTPVKPAATPTPSVWASSFLLTPEVPTEEETVVELKNRLAEEIVGAESDLNHKLKINGKACTCLERKHNLQIKSLSRELMPKDPNNPLYQKVIDWFNDNEPKMTAVASASGQYDDEYLKLSGQLGSFRRQLTSTGRGIPVQPVKDFLKEKEG